MEKLFKYPSEFQTLPDHRAHSGQVVTVGDLVNGEEVCVDDGIEPLYKITATDGWTGEAFDSELEAIREDGDDRGSGRDEWKHEAVAAMRLK